jgi:hypothetical protein
VTETRRDFLVLVFIVLLGVARQSCSFPELFGQSRKFSFAPLLVRGILLPTMLLIPQKALFLFFGRRMSRSHVAGPPVVGPALSAQDVTAGTPENAFGVFRVNIHFVPSFLAWASSAKSLSMSLPSNGAIHLWQVLVCS